MKALIAKLKNAFRPLELCSYELFVMRALFALVVWHSMPGSINQPEQPEPVGLALWLKIPFNVLAHEGVYTAVRWILAIALGIYASGRLLCIALPVMLLALVGVGTLNNSQGAQNHSTQIIAFVLLAQCGWHVYARFARPKPGENAAARRLREGRLGVWYGQQAIAAAYVVSALTKWLARGDWMRDSYQFPLQVVKAQRMDYYNRLEDGAASSGTYGWLSDALRPIAGWMERVMMESPQWAPLLVAPGFLLELFAFFLLAGRKIGAALAVGLIGFHLTVAEMMSLNFKYNIALLVIFFSGISFLIAWPAATLGGKLARNRDPG